MGDFWKIEKQYSEREKLDEKRHDVIFWNNENVLFLVWSNIDKGVCNCQNSWNWKLNFLHVILCKLYFNRFVHQKYLQYTLCINEMVCKHLDKNYVICGIIIFNKNNTFEKEVQLNCII